MKIMSIPAEPPADAIEPASIETAHRTTPGPGSEVGEWDRTDAVVAAWLTAHSHSNATQQSLAAWIGAPAHVRRSLPGGPRSPRQPDPLTWIPWAREHNIAPLAPRADHIDRWLAATGLAVHNRQIAASTRTHRYRALSALLNWAAHRDYIDPVVLPNAADRRAHGITRSATSGTSTTGLPPAAVTALLWAADHADRTTSHKPGAASPAARRARSRVLLALLLGAGLRVSELVALQVTDYWRSQQQGIAHLRVTGKGGEKREQPLPAWAADVVDEYLRHGRITRNSTAVEVSTGTPRSGGSVPLVTGDAGQELNRRTIADILARLARLPKLDSDDQNERAHAEALARLPRNAKGHPAVHPHQLRHATAHRVLDAGGDIEDVREFMRHASITTTQIYLNSRERRADRVADMLD